MKDCEVTKHDGIEIDEGASMVNASVIGAHGSQQRGSIEADVTPLKTAKTMHALKALVTF